MKHKDLKQFKKEFKAFVGTRNRIDPKTGKPFPELSDDDEYDSDELDNLYEKASRDNPNLQSKEFREYYERRKEAKRKE